MACRIDRTPTHARLRATFGRILVLTGGGVVACGGLAGDPAGSNPSAPRSLCGTARPESFPAGLRASPPQDYVASRFESAFLQGAADGDEGEEAWTSRTSSPNGTPCATATNPEDCRRRFEGVHLLPRTRAECERAYPNVVQPAGAHAGCRVSYLVYTRGDEVGTATSDAEVAALLGAIDTVQEADWTLRRTWEPMCGSAKGQDFTVREVDGGYEFVFANNCERASIIRTVHVAANGAVMEKAQRKADPGTQFTCAIAGRRPDGFSRGASDPKATARGAWFSEMAELEAAAVIAFRRLSRDLASLDAPADLRARVRDATRDEIRHTRSMRALARRDGVEPKVPSAPPTSPRRDLIAVALENAREGCVRETYGALVAWHQAIHAADPDVRVAMGTIADDETAHAALSIDLGRWLSERLNGGERHEVTRARACAFVALSRELDELDVASLEQAPFERSVGLPARGRAKAMLAALAEMG